MVFQTFGKTLSKEYRSILFLSDIRIDMSIADMLSQFGGRWVVDRNSFDHRLKY